VYGYIFDNGMVGEVFETLPPKGQYPENYRAGIAKLPEGVGSGWKRVSKSKWLTPGEVGRDRAERGVRERRNRLLDRCDVALCNAANWELMDPCEKAEWHVYKQALRDLPDQAGFPYEVAWPVRPGAGL
jgi:hypothetical protein